MKTVFLHLLAFCAVLAPLHTAEARAPKPPAVFGGFPVGKTFTFTVSNLTSSSQTLGGSPVAAPVPKGIPAFALGEQITFTIGKKGELLGPQKLKVLFQADGGTANAYVNKPARGASPNTATVYKNTTTGEPTAVGLFFFQVKIARRIPTVTMVTYTLN
jgi:hypothetical protein